LNNAIATLKPAPRAAAALASRPWGDEGFKWLTLLAALSVFALIILIGYELAQGSHLALRQFGWRFLTGTDWDPVNEQFGALPQIYYTLVSSATAVVIAVPLSIATAVFLTELAPRWLKQIIGLLVEMLAAVPSVIFGLWGLYVLVPWLASHVYPRLQAFLGFLPMFRGPIYGPCVLSAGIILAIMILPIITSMSREILSAVPDLQREAAYALGATRWEVTRVAVLSYARKGLCGAVVLGLGRALGETMAVTMVIGNSDKIAVSLFAPGATLASKVASEFTEATTDVYLGTLFELGLVLLGVTVVVNALAQLLLKTFAAPSVGRQR
jgi:phosphate transport system permease protein